MITLNCDRIKPAAKKNDKECLTAGLTIGRRKLQLKCKFCFVFQPSFADEFSVSCAFFRHEQRGRRCIPTLSESNLILNQAGLFGLGLQRTGEMIMCPKHRQELTVN